MSETDYIPSPHSVSDSSDEGFESGNNEFDSDSMPSLENVTHLSDDQLDAVSESSVQFGDPEETLDDRLNLWARAAEAFGERREVQPRSHQLGDVLGNTVAALLDFFQPYPGDESVPWSDERRDSVRFLVLRASEEIFTIEDAMFDAVTILPLEYLRVPAFHLVEWYARNRANVLGVEYPRVLPIHHFPIEELLADAVQQYFWDVGRDVPMFQEVGIGRVPREPDYLEGPDEFLITIPLGENGLHEIIPEGTLLNPRLNLVGWVLKRQLKCILRENNRRNGWDYSHRGYYFGTLFDEPDLESEGEYILFCGGVQIPADGMKGISRTASTPRITDRVVARPLVIVVRVNGEPVRALVDSGSLGDLVSTRLVDQLRLKRKELRDPITLQLAVQGSRSMRNSATRIFRRNAPSSLRTSTATT